MVRPRVELSVLLASPVRPLPADMVARQSSGCPIRRISYRHQRLAAVGAIGLRGGLTHLRRSDGAPPMRRGIKRAVSCSAEFHLSSRIDCGRPAFPLLPCSKPGRRRGVVPRGLGASDAAAARAATGDSAAIGRGAETGKDGMRGASAVETLPANHIRFLMFNVSRCPAAAATDTLKIGARRGKSPEVALSAPLSRWTRFPPGRQWLKTDRDSAAAKRGAEPGLPVEAGSQQKTAGAGRRETGGCLGKIEKLSRRYGAVRKKDREKLFKDFIRWYQQENLD